MLDEPFDEDDDDDELEEEDDELEDDDDEPEDDDAGGIGTVFGGFADEDDDEEDDDEEDEEEELEEEPDGFDEAPKRSNTRKHVKMLCLAVSNLELMLRSLRWCNIYVQSPFACSSNIPPLHMRTTVWEKTKVEIPLTRRLP